MITVHSVDKDTKNWVEYTGGILLEVPQFTFRQDLMLLYVDAVIVGSEKLIIKSAAKDNRIPLDKIYYDAYLDLDKIKLREMEITEIGTYRVPIPITINEEWINLIFNIENGSASQINIWIIPGSFHF